MKTLSWRKDIRLDAALCFSGTHASVRFTRETFVTRRLPREACLDLDDVKVVKAVVTFREEEDEDTLVEKGRQIGRGTVFLRETCHREIQLKKQS